MIVAELAAAAVVLCAVGFVARRLGRAVVGVAEAIVESQERVGRGTHDDLRELRERVLSLELQIHRDACLIVDAVSPQRRHREKL